MKARISDVLLLTVLVLLLAALLLRPARRTMASPQTFGVCVSQVPTEWGTFEGGSEQTGVAFEDKSGTLRFITSFPCNGTTPPIALVVRRVPGS